MLLPGCWLLMIGAGVCGGAAQTAYHWLATFQAQASCLKAFAAAARPILSIPLDCVCVFWASGCVIWFLLHPGSLAYPLHLSTLFSLAVS